MVRSTTLRPGSSSAVFAVPRNSTVDLIAMELRTAIFSGALAVGSSVREVEISAQLGVSRGPFREAAQRLVQEGLLTSIPGRGLRVTELDAAGISDVYEARLAVEGQAARIVAANRTDEALAMLRESFDAYVEASRGDDAWAIGDADLAFHQALVDLTGSRRLSRIMATLVIETRIASLSVADGFSVRRSVSPTYEALLSALAAGDANAAITALEQQFDDAIARLNGQDDSVPVLETMAEPEHEFQPIETGAIQLP